MLRYVYLPKVALAGLSGPTRDVCGNSMTWTSVLCAAFLGCALSKLATHGAQCLRNAKNLLCKDLSDPPQRIHQSTISRLNTNSETSPRKSTFEAAIRAFSHDQHDGKHSEASPGAWEGRLSQSVHIGHGHESLGACIWSEQF